MTAQTECPFEYLSSEQPPVLDEGLTDSVLSWVENGGTLVALRDAALWAQGAIENREEAMENEGEDDVSNPSNDDPPEANPPTERSNFNRI